MVPSGSLLGIQRTRFFSISATWGRLGTQALGTHVVSLLPTAAPEEPKVDSKELRNLSHDPQSEVSPRSSESRGQCMKSSPKFSRRSVCCAPGYRVTCRSARRRMVLPSLPAPEDSPGGLRTIVVPRDLTAVLRC